MDVFLIHNRRIFHLHVGAPCTTFSNARNPKERTRWQPLGKDPTNAKILYGNLMLLRTMLFLFAIRLVGQDRRTRWTQGTHENPASDFSWRVPSVSRIFGAEGCGTVTLSYCSFGAPVKNNTTIGYVFATHMERFRGRTCKGGHSHEMLVGSKTTHASEYPPGLCDEVSDVIAKDRELSGRHFADRPRGRGGFACRGFGAYI